MLFLIFPKNVQTVTDNFVLPLLIMVYTLGYIGKNVEYYII